MGTMWSEEGRYLSGEESVPVKATKAPLSQAQQNASKPVHDTNLSMQYDNDGNAIYKEPKGHAINGGH